MEIRVYYEDVDIGGVVYHSRYLNYCERARSELFFTAGKLPVWNGYHFIVKEITARYIGSLRFGDLARVETELADLKRASLTLCQKIYKEEKPLFEMVVELVCLKDRRVAKIPDYFLELLVQIPLCNTAAVRSRSGSDRH